MAAKLAFPGSSTAVGGIVRGPSRFNITSICGRSDSIATVAGKSPGRRSADAGRNCLLPSIARRHRRRRCLPGAAQGRNGHHRSGRSTGDPVGQTAGSVPSLAVSIQKRAGTVIVSPATSTIPCMKLLAETEERPG